MSNRTKKAVRRRSFSSRVVRPAGIAISAATACLVTLPMTPPAMGATALFVGGIAEPNLYEPIMSKALGGKFTGIDPVSSTAWVRKSVNWPAEAAPYWGSTSLAQSVDEGVDNLYAAIKNPQNSGPITVVGASAGALVLDETLRRLSTDVTAPAKDDLTFVVIGDGSRQDSFKSGSALFGSLAGYTYQTPAETKYDVKVVSYEYDGFADYPDRWWNLVADANAFAGILYYHNATFTSDISGSNLVPYAVSTNSSQGTTTKYRIPSETLPLVSLFPSLAPMEESLKRTIDSGYSRNDAPAATSAATLSTASTPAATTAAVTRTASVATTSAATHSRPKLGATAQKAVDSGTKLSRGNVAKPRTSSGNSRKPAASLSDAVRHVVKTIKAVSRPAGSTGAGKDKADTAG
jgi:hypothetical protein